MAIPILRNRIRGQSRMPLAGDFPPANSQTETIESSVKERIELLQKRIAQGCMADDGSPGTERARIAVSKRGKKNPERFHFGVRYDSGSEAACAEMLERYIPNFRTIPHVTYQVPAFDEQTGGTRTIDFRVGDKLIEFHPPRTWRHGKKFGDFESAKEYADFRREINSRKSREGKGKVRERWESMLTERYRQKRQALADSNPALQGCKVIVATSGAEFYDKVIRPLSPKPPPRGAFIAEFKFLARQVFLNNQNPLLQEPHLPRNNPPRDAPDFDGTDQEAA
ncbi:MAG: hypothetical protein KDD70_18720 [Bdellovibrionales bacterium]|nr:hypothetical protein [Bdellovibrionales bacterium]